MIEADVSTVSKHLSVLSNVGIVRSEKHGNQVYYHLQTPCILNFFGCVEAVIESTAKEQAALVKP
jgi:ArsR family transcriptional regulator